MSQTPNTDDYTPLATAGGRDGDDGAGAEVKARATATARIASLDVFRGLSIALMIFVDYAGSVFPSVAHSPWNGLQLADFVMPFFLFIVGVSLTLAYKRVSHKAQASQKAIVRTIKLFLLGIFLQGGYFHGIKSLTYGIDVEKIRWLGILQRIAIGYIVAALCEIWSSKFTSRETTDGFFYKYFLQWFMILSLCFTYMVLLYGLNVPDWEFSMQGSMIMVKCQVKGDLSPVCNSAGMVDRYILGIEHLYKKPPYRNLRECSTSEANQLDPVLGNPPLWCQAPFDPEGILSSLMAAVTCLFGLHFGHVLVQLEGHKERLCHWLIFSLSLLLLGLLFNILGVPLNKSLYTISYMLVTTASAGITFCILYYLVDLCSYKCLFFALEWMGRHALSIFVLIASNIAVIVIQGFYWRNPDNNIIHWIVGSTPKVKFDILDFDF